MRFVRFIATGLLLLLCSGIVLIPVTAQEGETLVVYSGRSEGLIGPILEQFTAETGVQIEVRYGGTSEMAATILEEGDNSPADVFIAQDAGALGALAKANRLAVLPSDILERVPTEFISPAGTWVGLSGRARVLVYNTDLITVDQLPASILDLTQPQWAGLVGWAPANGSFQSNITAMRILLGEDTTKSWLEGMVANDAQVYNNNSSIVQAVINGEISVGLVNHYYLFQFLAENPDVPAANYYFPSGDIGSLINAAGAGVVNTSDHPGLAQRLLLYLLSTKGQTYFTADEFEYPLVPGVTPRADLKPLAEIEAPQIDLSDLDDLQGTLDLLRETGALP